MFRARPAPEGALHLKAAEMAAALAERSPLEEEEEEDGGSLVPPQPAHMSQVSLPVGPAPAARAGPACSAAGTSQGSAARRLSPQVGTGPVLLSGDRACAAQSH